MRSIHGDGIDQTIRRLGTADELFLLPSTTWPVTAAPPAMITASPMTHVLGSLEMEQLAWLRIVGNIFAENEMGNGMPSRTWTTRPFSTGAGTTGAGVGAGGTGLSTTGTATGGGAAGMHGGLEAAGLGASGFGFCAATTGRCMASITAAGTPACVSLMMAAVERSNLLG